jgi:hypothetical protein
LSRHLAQRGRPPGNVAEGSPLPHESALSTTLASLADLAVVRHLPAGAERLWARVLYASADEVTLLLPCPFWPGESLELSEGAGGAAEPRLLRVARLGYLRPAAWQVRCEFVS